MSLFHGGLERDLLAGNFSFHHLQDVHDFFVEVGFQRNRKRGHNLSIFDLALVFPLQFVLQNFILIRK